MYAPAFASDHGARQPRAQRALRIARSWLPARAVEADDETYLNGRLLRLVVLARAIVSSTGLVLVAVLALQTGMQVPVLAIGSILAVVGLASWAALARTREGGRATETDLLRQIVADVIVLTAVITLAGGHPASCPPQGAWCQLYPQPPLPGRPDELTLIVKPSKLGGKPCPFSNIPVIDATTHLTVW